MSAAEESFDEMVAFYGLGEGMVTEYRFHITRRWRFDRAWPNRKVAVEIEGITGGAGGRHQRVAGFLGDCEKYEAAMLHGWTVYRVPAPWILKGKRRVWRQETVNALKFMLGVVTTGDSSAAP